VFCSSTKRAISRWRQGHHKLRVKEELVFNRWMKGLEVVWP